MNVIIKRFLNACIRFFSVKSRWRLILLGILITIACVDFFSLGLVRRTFVFYSISNGKMTVENRMLNRSESVEQSISRYVEETLLGPGLPGVLPLFPGGTKLRSLMLRDDIVYTDFSEDAALPPGEGGDTFTNFHTLYSGIRRNFPIVRDVRFFIMGRAAYHTEFRRIFDEGNEKQAVGP